MPDVRKVLSEVSKNGKIFGVTFIKKDGTKRNMSCRLGVTKHLRGGSSTTTHIKEYMTVYSQNDKGYRKVNISTITKIKGNKQVFRF